MGKAADVRGQDERDWNSERDGPHAAIREEEEHGCHERPVNRFFRRRPAASRSIRHLLQHVRTAEIW